MNGKSLCMFTWHTFRNSYCRRTTKEGKAGTMVFSDSNNRELCKCAVTVGYGRRCWVTRQLPENFHEANSADKKTDGDFVCSNATLRKLKKEKQNCN